MFKIANDLKCLVIAIMVSSIPCSAQVRIKPVTTPQCAEIIKVHLKNVKTLNQVVQLGAPFPIVDGVQEYHSFKNSYAKCSSSKEYAQDLMISSNSLAMILCASGHSTGQYTEGIELFEDAKLYARKIITFVDPGSVERNNENLARTLQIIDQRIAVCRGHRLE